MEHLRSLTDSLGAEPLDSAVEEYALQVIADEDVEDGLSTVSDLLSGTLPEFASLGEERQTVMLIELWAKVLATQYTRLSQGLPLPRPVLLTRVSGTLWQRRSATRQLSRTRQARAPQARARPRTPFFSARQRASQQQQHLTNTHSRSPRQHRRQGRTRRNPVAHRRARTSTQMCSSCKSCAPA